MNVRLINWLLFLINPFISMLLAFKEYTQPYAKNIFWAFCVFYGLTFAIGIESSNGDIVRYLAELQYLHSKYEFTTNDIINYFQDSGEVDILNTFLSYIISRYTESQVILTTVYAVIFGFFYSRNIWYILGLLKGKQSLIIKMVLLSLILVVPIWNINGFRMYVAFHIFIYGLLPYIFENKKSRLIFIFLSFWVHFSYIVPIVLFLIYLFIGNRINLYFFIFVGSLFISEINVNLINQYIDRFAPQSINERSIGYRDESTIDASKEGRLKKPKTVWYARWFSKVLRYALIVFIFYFFYNRNIIFIQGWNKLFSFSLIFFSISNFLSFLPSGGRFYIFAIFLSLIMVILYLDNFREDIRFKRLVTILTPAFLLFIIVAIRLGLYTTSITTIIGNPLIALFTSGDPMSLNDLIK